MAELTFFPSSALPPLLANSAQYVSVAGTNAPVEYMAYDTTTEEHRCWGFTMPADYAGEDLTVTIRWNAANATTGNVVWGVALLATTPNTDAGSWQAEGFGTEDVSADDTHLGTASLRVHSIACTLTGAELDGAAAGDECVIKIARKVGSDNMANDAQIISFTVSY
jgi:hypothetical protein